MKRFGLSRLLSSNSSAAADAGEHKVAPPAKRQSAGKIWKDDLNLRKRRFSKIRSKIEPETNREAVSLSMKPPTSEAECLLASLSEGANVQKGADTSEIPETKTSELTCGSEPFFQVNKMDTPSHKAKVGAIAGNTKDTITVRISDVSGGRGDGSGVEPKVTEIYKNGRSSPDQLLSPPPMDPDLERLVDEANAVARRLEDSHSNRAHKIHERVVEIFQSVHFPDENTKTILNGPQRSQSDILPSLMSDFVSKQPAVMSDSVSNQPSVVGDSVSNQPSAVGDSVLVQQSISIESETNHQFEVSDSAPNQPSAVGDSAPNLQNPQSDSPSRRPSRQRRVLAEECAVLTQILALERENAREAETCIYQLVDTVMRLSASNDGSNGQGPLTQSTSIQTSDLIRDTMDQSQKSTDIPTKSAENVESTRVLKLESEISSLKECKQMLEDDVQRYIDEITSLRRELDSQKRLSSKLQDDRAMTMPSPQAPSVDGRTIQLSSEVARLKQQLYQAKEIAKRESARASKLNMKVSGQEYALLYGNTAKDALVD
eukprot:909026_1